LHDQGVEFVLVGLEMGGAEVLRPYIEDAAPEHPSLIDETHLMDARFGVTNIPSGIWIDEQGMIVRPHDGDAVPPPVMRPAKDGTLKPFGLGGRFGHSPDHYADMVRDWLAKGQDSQYAMTPDEVVAASHPQTREISEAAAHFELAQHVWRTEGFSPRALAHFARAHTLQPDNITYKRQAYSQYRTSVTDDPNENSRFLQQPEEGEDWPFVSDFLADMAAIGRPMGQPAKRTDRGGT
jgi:hypothetical protein